MNTEEQPETLSAILAEMRDARNAASDMTLVPTEWLTQWADRIEAAAERERRKYERLHECFWSDGAIQNIVRQLLDERNDLRNQNPKASEVAAHFAQLLEKAATRSHGNAAAMRDLLEKIRHEYGWGLIGCRTCVSSEADVERVSDLFEKQIDAALAAPARNCDRFATEDETREAYWAYREPLEFNNKPFVAITEWLFAPAEGGSHA